MQCSLAHARDHYTHLKPAAHHLATDISGEFDIYVSGLMEHDGHVCRLLRLLHELKIADNTVVVYPTDIGAMVSWWPDAGTTPFRGEKTTTWEGGVRVPMLVCRDKNSNAPSRRRGQRNTSRPGRAGGKLP